MMTVEGKNDTEEKDQQELPITELKRSVDDEIKGFSEDFYGKLQASGTDSVFYYLISINLYKILEKYLKGELELIELIWPNEKQFVSDYLEENIDKNFRKNLTENKVNLKDSKELTALIKKTLGKEKSRIRTFEPLFERLLIVTETMEKMGKYFEDKEFVLRILVAELREFHSIGMFSRTIINIPSEQLSKPIISRGDLKIQIDVGKPILVAGDEFSIFVKITNPYEVPLVLFSVDTQIPVDLGDVLGESREKYLKGGQTEKKTTIIPWQRQTPEEDRIAHGIATTDLDYLKQKTSNLILPPILLQPDDSIIKQFILKTKNKWLFTPIALTLEIQVKYGVDHREHLDTAKVDLTIQSALSSIAAGAIIGGILGSVVGILYRPKSIGINESLYLNIPELPLFFNTSINPGYTHLGLNFIPWSINFIIIQSLNFALNHASYLLLSIILSTMVVVAFARKSGVQKIISIEDFYGGLFLGFLVGFSGPEYALNLIGGDQLGNVTNVTQSLASNLTGIPYTMNQSVQTLPGAVEVLNQTIIRNS